MPRILLVFEPPYGGVAEHVRQLAVQLAARGHDVEVAGPRDATAYAAIEDADIPLFRLPLEPGFTHPLLDVRALRRIADLLRSRHYEVVHCHGAKAGVLVRMAAARVRVPVVYTPHCFRFVGPVSRRRRAVATTIERLLAPRTAAVLCVCEDEFREAVARRVAPESRLHVIYNGCEPCAETVEPEAELVRMRREGPLAGVVTVLREQKQVDFFLEAVPEIWRRLPEAQLAVVGNGPLESELVARAHELELDRDRRFRFLPFRPPSARYLRALDVYVLPSAWEAFPIGILEAMACGVPQVATDVGGTPEAVSAETGLLVPPDDHRALATAVVELLADPDRRGALARASTARHAEQFGLDRMVGEIVAVYEDVMPPAS